MRVRAAALLAALVVGAAAPPPGASNCSGCHRPASLPLAGRSAGSIEGAMLGYRSGAVPSTIMGRLMKGLTPEQIQAIAAWVATAS